MSKIVPFKGLRPAAGKASQIASPPYDVINSQEARVMAAGHPLSFLHVVKPEIDLPESTLPYADEVYQKAKSNFDGLIQDGHLVFDETPCFYLYRQEMKIGERVHRQIGVVAGASVEEYDNGFIKKHEFTRVDKERDRTRHVETLGADAGPVFLTYVATQAIDQLVANLSAGTPDVDFVADDGIGHTLWVVREKGQIEQLTAAFAAVPSLYIADGHHRAASGCAAGRKARAANPNHQGNESYNSFLTVIFPHNQMMILDYNRIVFDLNGLPLEDFLAQIKAKFEVAPAAAPKPTQTHHFGMYVQGQWMELVARPDSFDAADPVACLDVAILQNNLLNPILGIGDPRTDDRIDFVGGIRGTDELERRVDADGGVAFSLFPTPIEDLMAIADAGEVMPPKSTWFEPKLRSGLVVKTRD